METKGNGREGAKTRPVKTSTELPVVEDIENCDFHGYDADMLMKETAKLRKIITKRGTIEILIPLCCTTAPVRYLKFRIQ